MADDSHWLVTIFLKCQVATIRQMFHRICIHVIQKLRATEKDRYLLPWVPASHHDVTDMVDADAEEEAGMLAGKESTSSRYFPPKDTVGTIGSFSPVTRSVKHFLNEIFSILNKSNLQLEIEIWATGNKQVIDMSRFGVERV